MAMRKKMLKKDNGFTLIELLIAMFILSVGILGLISMFETAMRATTNGRNLTTASRLVAKHLEEVRGVAFNNVANNILGSGDYTNQNSVVVGDTTTLTANYQEDTGSLNSADFGLTMIYVVDNPIEFMDKLVIRATWTDRFGAHSSSAVTFIESLS